MLPEDGTEAEMTATLDSGCEDNWITWSKMSEDLAMTENDIVPPETQPGKLSSSFTDFSGNEVEPLGLVEIRFRARGSGLSDTAWFYVLDNERAPFDVLFGNVWMSKHDGGPTFFKKPVLINAGKPLSTSTSFPSSVSGFLC